MNKNRIIMSAFGGFALAAVLAFGYLAYDAWSERDELLENIAREQSTARRILAAEVPPTQASLERICANTNAVAQWCAETRELLSEGDVTLDRSASATAFKAQMGEDARTLAKLPGGLDGKIVREAFDFGFKSYIIDGNIPSEAELDALKRQWTEVKTIVETLSAAGAVELQAIEVAAAEKKVEAPKEEPRRGFGARRQQQKKEEPPPCAYQQMKYTVRFTARPLAFVKALNAFAASEHLLYVESMSLVREKDMLGDMLGAGKKDQDAGSKRPRRRRAEKAVEENEGEEVARKGLVTDPLIEAPFVVTLKLASIDFGTNGSVAPKADEKEDKE